MSWSYDADGNHTSFTDTSGATTYPGMQQAGSRPCTTRGGFTRDAFGGLAAVTAGDLVQEWAYRERYLAEHTRRVDSVSDASALFCGDKDGRITGLNRAGTVTRYGYNGARLACCQAHG